MKIRIDNGRLIDPAAGLDAAGSLCVSGGSIVAAGATPRDFQPDTVIDAAGRWVCPGIIDLSVRFAGSGAGFRSGLAGETAAAAAAGVTSVCCPPDTSPVMDTPAVVELIRHAGAGAGEHDLGADQAAGAGDFGIRLRFQGQGAGIEKDGLVEVLPRLGEVDVVEVGPAVADGVEHPVEKPVGGVYEQAQPCRSPGFRLAKSPISSWTAPMYS